MVSRTPTVSVVVPNYNHARFLRERLDSIYDQRFRDFEVILLDDRSSDGSVDILRDYARRANTRLAVSSRNSGSPFAQWNRGVGLACGEYVWIAESDDYAEPGFLDACIDRLAAGPTLGLAYTDSWMVDEDGDRLERRSTFLAEKLNEAPEQEDHIRCGRDEVITRMIRWNTIPNASAAVFKRRLFLDVGGADAAMRLAGDWLMWIKILERCDIAYIAEPLNYNRTHAKSMRSRFGSDLTGLGEKIAVLRYALEHFPLDNQVASQALNTIAGPRRIERIRRSALRSLTMKELLSQVSDDELFAPASLKFAAGNVGRRIWKRICSATGGRH